MNLFNVGFLEILVIVLMAFILFGPQRLLSLAASLRKALTEFQRSASDMASTALDQQGSSPSTPSEPQEGEGTPFVREADGLEGADSQDRKSDEFRGGSEP
ncbi:MAG: twin-arginine translocase TatA/TatE family subunit [Dehalococcoidia bacterium]